MLAASSTLIGTYIILLTSNPLSKRFGKRKMVMMDSVVMIAGTLTSVLSTSVIVICLGRLLMGEANVWDNFLINRYITIDSLLTLKVMPLSAPKRMCNHLFVN